MSILSWLGKTIRLTDRSFWSAYYGGETWAGEPINPETAMQIAAFWACVRLVAQTIGSLPLGVYRHKPDGSREAVPGNPLYKLIHDAPNAEHTAVEFWEGVGTCLCLAGNSFAEKTYRGTGARQQLVSIELLNPSFVALKRRSDGSIYYSYADQVRGARDITEDSMFHVRGFGMGGELGFSPISFARQSLSANRATEHAAAATFANGMRPGGWIVYKGGRTLTTGQREEAKKNLIEPMSGVANSGKTGILEGDFDYRQMTIPPEDAQLLETRAFGVEEVCRVFGVPPVLVGHAQAGQTMWGCLPASTLVLTSTGPRSIAAVAVGDTVWTLDGDRMVQRRVLRSGQTGTLPLYTIRTRSRTVRATGNHKFLVRRKYAAPRPGPGGYRAIEWRNEWIEASQLTPADYLVAAHGLVGETGETIAPNGRALTDDFMEACGLYVADGVSLPHTATEILALGFEEAAHLPGWLYGLTRPLLLAFLRGYLDGDGHVSKAGWITWSSANPDLLEDVRALCIVAGIPVGDACDYPMSPATGTVWQAWSFSVEHNRQIGSRNPRSRERFEAAATSSRVGRFDPNYLGRGPAGSRPGEGFAIAGAVLARVLAVTRAEPAVPVFDLEVEGTHNFVADGIVVHNSGIEQMVIGWYALGLRPYLTRIEQCVKRALISPDDKAAGLYVEFNLEGLLRADSAARGEFYWKMIQVGAMTPNEVCDKENLPRFEGGDRHYINTTLAALDDEGKVILPAAAPAPAPDPAASSAPRRPPLEVVK